jgi:hypothetical protein
MIVLRVSLLVALVGWSLPVGAGAFPTAAPSLVARGSVVDPRAAVALDDERLTEWPALVDEATAKREVARLRKAETEEMGLDAATRIRETGAGFAPLLLEALGKERDVDTRARLTDALTSITAAPHTRLLAREWNDKSEHVRAFALARVAAFPDAGLAETARAHYLALEALAADPKAKAAPSAEELDLAARAALASGALEGMERALVQAETNWRGNGPSLRVAARGVRGDAATAYLLPKLLEAGTDARRVAALNLLGSAGTKEAVSTVRRFLEAEANPVRVAAINALRGIVDDAPPLDNLSVFTAIEEAKRWKERT